MAYGVEQNIGFGNAQVLPQGPSVNAFVKQITEQRNDRDRFAFEKSKFDYAKQEKEKDKQRDDELSKLRIIGDVLDPRNFNNLVHNELRTATSDLAKQLKGKTVTDVYQLAQEQAGKIGYMSDQFTLLQDKLTKEREQYKANKRLNVNAAAEDALQEGIRRFRADGKLNLDEISLTNTFNRNPSRALIGGSAYMHDINPDEKVPYSSKYQYKDSKLGGKSFSYKFDNFPPYYDVQENGKTDAPTITTRSEPSGIKIGDVEQPMLTEQAYNRYGIDEANIISLNKRIKDEYPNIDLESEQAERLRRVYAYKDVDERKPIPQRVETMADPRTSISVNVGGALSKSEDLLKYDVLETYKNKVKPIKKGAIYRKDGKVTREEYGESFEAIETKDIDERDIELIGTDPYKDRGMTYYKVRPDGDWEGKGGQVISWAKVAQANLDKTSANEAARRRTELTADKTKNPKAGGSTMVTVILKDGRQGQIPSDKVAQFLKDNPGSKKQ